MARDKADKISPEFEARLARLEPDQTVRVIVLVRPPNERAGGGLRQSPAQRQAAVAAQQQAAEAALQDIDATLERLGGRRLSESANALGSVPVETTVAGVKALAGSDRISAIFEDQKIHRLF